MKDIILIYNIIIFLIIISKLKYRIIFWSKELLLCKLNLSYLNIWSELLHIELYYFLLHYLLNVQLNNFIYL